MHGKKQYRMFASSFRLAHININCVPTHMSVKEIRELELKKQKKQGRRDYAKQQVDEKPATFEDREFLKNFLDAGDDID